MPKLTSQVPNVGKSTFINLFKKSLDSDKNKLKVAPHPGVTKNMSSKVKVMTNPLTYIYDTPGVNLPKPDDFDSAMKLAVIGSIPEHVTGIKTLLCLYGCLLHRLNNKNYH